MDRSEYYQILKDRYEDVGILEDVAYTFQKFEEHFATHERIMVSISGGSDSDCITHIIVTYFPEYIDKCHFVFCDTGLEYEATKRHIKYMQERYGIEIKTVHGTSVVTAVSQYGVPILNKYKSNVIEAYQRGKQYAERYIFDDSLGTFHVMRFTDKQREMVRYATSNGIKISDKCCDVSKKKPLQDYEAEHDIDLNVTGERRAEGGRRAMSHKSCFEQQSKGMHKFMPIWWWSNNTKALFKQQEGIVYSDCYEVWGATRTGCVGCPFSLSIKEDLERMKIFEPRMYDACMKVFGTSYELTDMFKCHQPADRSGKNNTMYGRTLEDSPLAKRVLCVETGKIYSCIKVAAEDTGCFATGITAVCRGKRKTHGGYRWQYVD